MKKTLVRFCSIAMIGFALAACGGHHDHDNDNSGMDTTAAAKPAEEHHEREHTPKHEEHSEAPKDTVATEKGAPVVNTSDTEKPKDESTMNSGTEKKHVKPGGVQGTKQ